jgi:hypothetical protein
MGTLGAVRSICIAEYGVIKGMAVLALFIVAYLYWTERREKRERRRQQRAVAERRRAREAATPQK